MSDRAIVVWTIAIAVGFALCAFACEGPGLEPPFSQGPAAGGSGAMAAGTGGTTAPGTMTGGSSGKGGSGGSAPNAAGGSGGDVGTRDGGIADYDGGADEDAGQTR